MAQQIAEITKVPTNAQVIKILNEVIKRYNSLGSIYTFKGSVQTYDDLLIIQNPNVGDVYNVIEEDVEHQVAAGSNFVWDGTVWDNLGGSLAGLVQSVNGINPDSLGNVLLSLIKNITTNQGVITFTKNDDTTIQVDNIKKLYTVALGQTVDLNNLVEAGVYMCGNNSYAANYENCPVQKSFLLEVQQANDGNMVYQFLTQYNDGSMEAGNQYVRTYQVTHGWSAWRMAGSGSNLTTYTSLEQIGITPGEETFASIHNALPINAMLIYYHNENNVDDNQNDAMYPCPVGYIKITKLTNQITQFECIQYEAYNNPNGNVDEKISVGNIWETYYNAQYPQRVVTWNKHIASSNTTTQEIKSRLDISNTNNEAIRLNNVDQNLTRDIVGYDVDGSKIGLLRFGKYDDGLTNGVKLAASNSSGTSPDFISLYLNEETGKGFTRLYQNVVVQNGELFFTSATDNNARFGYKSVKSSTDVTNLPQGNYFFYGTAAEGDSDTVLAGNDFQGISMRQSGQAFQIVCRGSKTYWRYDDNTAVATNPQYSSWIQFSDSNNLASAKSINTNGIELGNYYYRLPDGLQICMGVVKLSYSGDEKQVGPFNFAAAFTHAPEVVACMINRDTNYPNHYDAEVQVRSISTTNFYLYQQSMGEAWFYRASYVAIGRWK